jgi:hypothetical protein
MREQPDVSCDSTTVASQTLAHRHRCCAPTAADSRSDRRRPMKRSATHSDTATQRHSTLSTAHCCQRRSERNIHTDPQTRSAAATHTTTLHTQRARQRGSNTQRRRSIAHPPTTPSSVQRSHSAHTTLAARCRSRCWLLHYSSATLRLRHARSRDTSRTSA